LFAVAVERFAGSLIFEFPPPRRKTRRKQTLCVLSRSAVSVLATMEDI
jgi:hypothetical protein